MKRILTFSFFLILGIFSQAIAHQPSHFDILEKYLNLNQTQFFSIDQTDLTEREFQLLDENWFGIAVNLPLQIDTRTHDNYPMVMASRYSGERGWKIPLKTNCVLVGTDLLSGRVFYSKAFEDSQRTSALTLELNPAPKPKPANLPLQSAGIRILDLKNRMGLEWNTGHWSFGVIHYDWASNTKESILIGNNKPSHETNHMIHTIPVNTSKTASTFLASENQTTMTEPGLLFNVELVEKKGDIGLFLNGSFAVNTRDYNIPPRKDLSSTGNDKKNISALVPLSMALIGLDWDEPIRFDWTNPTFGEKIATGDLVSGFFSLKTNIDLEELGPGEYMIYIIMDGRIYGPQMIEVK